MNFSAITHTYSRFPVVLRLFLIVLTLIITAGIVIHFIEPETFPTLFEGIWWAIVTAATVGYGDYTPVTTVGRLFALLVILFGIGVVSFFVTSFASSTITTRNALMYGEISFKKKNHFVVIGWNERSKNVIVQTQKANPRQEIVLIDSTLRQCPLKTELVHFIRGNPIEDYTLKRANIEFAHTVVITADFHIPESEADSKSIVTLLAIKGLNPDIYSVVEILTPRQKNNCIRAGANEIIETSLLSGLALYNSTLFHGVTKIIYQLLDHQYEHMLLYEDIPISLVGKSFKECVDTFENKDSLIIGLNRKDEVKIHPTPSLIIEHGDQVIVIKR